MQKELDYLNVLKALEEIPFCVGKNLLMDVLTGNESNDSVTNNRLNKLSAFGSMAYDKDELSQMIDSLIMNNLVAQTSSAQNKFWKLLELTSKGKSELDTPTFHKKKLSMKSFSTEITEKDKILFAAFKDFLNDYNDDQKKAITTNSEKVLCIAGAGSGKTTVLTKRIEFLVKYRSIDPKKILAITFTRKAKEEMESRLPDLRGHVQIETFNSFCEKILRKYSHLIYERPVQVISYREKILMITTALSKLNFTPDSAINTYFTSAQQRGKEREQLMHIFMNDCFFVRDYFKAKGKQINIKEFSFDDDHTERSATLVFGICNFIESYMKRNGFRDFGDQIMDCMEFLKKNPDKISEYDHVLVDEYQDVNSTQIDLIRLIAPKNIFCVGDPRQSIFGWRGSDIRFILNFEEHHPAAELISLSINYRSSQKIVDLFNTSIKSMNLSDLTSGTSYPNSSVRLLEFDSEPAEFEFVIQAISETVIPRNEIFVLARTNRQLSELSQQFRLREISHVIRSEESLKEASSGEVMLATIHTIKGLEARFVFLIGATAQNFPCKGSDHPVIDMVKVEEYDKEEEERRLFYVALSRAKEHLCISHTGKRTNYITKDMEKLLFANTSHTIKTTQSKPLEGKIVSTGTLERLKEWRSSLSRKLGVPAYIIMHDSTLIDIAQTKPVTLDELESIKGFGPVKITRYGEEILNIIN
jgi:superfamily I DNA/RNA helicase